MELRLTTRRPPPDPLPVHRVRSEPVGQNWGLTVVLIAMGFCLAVAVGSIALALWYGR
jgi:hypothetical protein